MTQTDIRPGTQVKDKDGNVNYGLPMNVIDDNDFEVMVGYYNLDGNYQEGWMQRDRVIQVLKNN